MQKVGVDIPPIIPGSHGRTHFFEIDLFQLDAPAILFSMATLKEVTLGFARETYELLQQETDRRGYDPKWALNAGVTLRAYTKTGQRCAPVLTGRVTYATKTFFTVQVFTMAGELNRGPHGRHTFGLDGLERSIIRLSGLRYRLTPASMDALFGRVDVEGLNC